MSSTEDGGDNAMRQLDAERLRARLVDLVQTPSLTGDEGAAISLIYRWLSKLEESHADVEVDRWTASMAELEADPAYPGREVERDDVPVVAARVRGSRPGQAVVLTGHVDVVPPGDLDQWRDDPFAGEIEDGDRLVGRGACDMKAGVVAALEVFEAFARGPRDFAGEVVFVAVPGEEDGGTGTVSAIRRGWVGDVVIVTEPTSGGSLEAGPAVPEDAEQPPRDPWQSQPDPNAQPALVVAHAGAMTFTLTVSGRGAHACKRLEGESALAHFVTVHEALVAEETRVNEAETHPYMKALGLPYPTNVGKVQGGVWASSVMDQLTAEIRMGVALDETPAEAEFRLREVLGDLEKEDPWLSQNPVSIERTGATFSSAETDVGHPLVRTLRRAAAREFGGAPRLAGAPYGCDMRHWVHLANAAVVVYGPGDVRLAHAPNEWVSLQETERVARVLLAATAQLVEPEDGE